MENLDHILDAPAMQDRKFEFAGFWIRVGAYFIDLIILAVVQLILGLVITEQILLSVISLIIGVGYFGYMESSENQATLGKMAVGVKVTDYNGGRLEFGNAVGRYFAKILSGLVLGIGFMMVGWDDKKQGLHDKLANSYVIYK